MLWLIISILTITALAVGFIYLVNRFYKFNLIDSISKGNKKLKIIFSVLTVIFISLILYITMGYMNAIVCMLHLVIFWLIIDLIFWIIKKKTKRTPQKYYAGMIAILITIIYLSTGWYNANHVWQTNYIINTKKDIGNLRIIQFADSHVGTTFDGKGLNKYIKEIENLNPDVVLITGDFVDDDTSKEDMIDACQALGNLKTKYGVYFSFGNHDKGYYDESYRGYNGDDLIEQLEKNNVIVLQDENILIDNRFYIIGRQDRSEEQRGNIRASMSQLIDGIDQNKYIVVMDHQPNDYMNECNSNVDLVLSGHTHGGQFLPINGLGEWIGANDKTYGVEKKENTNFIVTSGISDWAIKFKTGCKSEYVVIDINQI